MSKVRMLRALVKQRLTAAAEEIFGLFEATIAEYEEELCRSKEENERQRERMDAVFIPQLRLHRAVLPGDVQRVLVVKEEVPPEQQEWSSSLDQEDTKSPPHIKEEQEDLWSTQEGEQLQGLEEVDLKFLFTSVPVKSEEDDGEEAQFSQLHQRQTEHMETYSAPPQSSPSASDRNSHPQTLSQPAAHDQALHSEPETDNSGDWDETKERQPGLNPLQNGDVAVRDSRCSAAKKKFSCSECGKRFRKKRHLEDHIRIHTGEKPFSCSVCKSSFKQSGGLHAHMRIHTGEKTISCSVCKKYFTRRDSLKTHMRIHTGEKPYNCSLCDKGFISRSTLKKHTITHAAETPFSCSVCKKGFAWSGLLERHMRIHTEDPPLNCSDCGKGFFFMSNLKNHMRTHTGEKPFSCSVCKKCFTQNGSLTTHMRTHTGEKPYHCSLCDKRFMKKSNLTEHMRSHTGEKHFRCSVCEKFYSNNRYLRKHMRIHTGEKPYTCSECDRGFSYREALIRHMRIHTEETPAAKGEDCGGPEPARNSDPDGLKRPDTEDETGDSMSVENHE